MGKAWQPRQLSRLNLGPNPSPTPSTSAKAVCPAMNRVVSSAVSPDSGSPALTPERTPGSVAALAAAVSVMKAIPEMTATRAVEVCGVLMAPPYRLVRQPVRTQHEQRPCRPCTRIQSQRANRLNSRIKLTRRNRFRGAVAHGRSIKLSRSADVCWRGEIKSLIRGNAGCRRLRTLAADLGHHSGQKATNSEVRIDRTQCRVSDPLPTSRGDRRANLARRVTR